MEKQEFIELIGEDPVDVLGGDWQNDVNETEEDSDPDGAIKLWNER